MGFIYKYKEKIKKIRDEENSSKNIFRHFKANKKRKELKKEVIHELQNTYITSDMIKEFCIYYSAVDPIIKDMISDNIKISMHESGYCIELKYDSGSLYINTGEPRINYARYEKYMKTIHLSHRDIRMKQMRPEHDIDLGSDTFEGFETSNRGNKAKVYISNVQILIRQAIGEYIRAIATIGWDNDTPEWVNLNGTAY